jgi:hypothetical protein
MEELIKQQIIEGRIWIGDCSWRDEPEDLEDLTDDEVIRGINWHYDGGWIQFVEDCRCL